MARSRASASYTITARDRTRAGVASAKQSINSLDTLVSKLGINFSILSAAAAAAPLGVVAANAPVIDSYGKLSEKLGISVLAVQGFIDAAERAGVAQNSLFTSLQRGVRRVSEAANGIGEARGALDELGLSAVQLEKLAPEERILSILDAIKNLGDEGDRVRIAAKIFDSEGVDLVRLTGDAVRDAASEMVNMQRALSEIDVAAVENMNDQMQLLQAYGRSAGQVFTAEMAPAITGLITLITGSTDSMDNFRDISRLSADTFIDVIGFIGNGVEGISNVFSFLNIQLQKVIVKGFEFDAFLGIEGANANIEEATQKLQTMQDVLAGKTGDATFWVQLEEQAERAREKSAEAAADLEKIRERFKDGIDVSLGVGELNLIGSSDAAAREAERIEKSFDSVVQQLETDSERIESTYQKRLTAVNAFRDEFPERVIESGEAAIRALEAREDALDELANRRIEEQDKERSAELQPLEFNLEAVRQQFATEADLLIEETEKRTALLAELGQLDAEQKAEADALIIALEQDKQQKLTQIVRDQESQRLSAQTGYAAQSLGVLSSLITNTGALGEKSTKIAARIAQGEALVAGISAAERARNHASLTGGVISGGLAAALSWAGTLANVAGIGAAAEGGTPGGPSTGGAVPTADAGTNQLLESGDDNEAQPLQVTFNLDPSLIDAKAFEDMTVKSVSNASSSKRLIVDVNDNKITSNSEDGD